MSSTKNKQKPKNILIAAGGTGGHIFPAIAMFDILQDSDYNIFFLIDKRFHKYESKARLENEYKNLKIFEIKTINYYGILGKVKQLCLMIYDIFACIKLILKYKISFTIGFGSYTSLIAVIASFLTKTKIAVHEQNAVLGRANYISGFLADYILLTFDKTLKIPKYFQNKILSTGMPVRTEIKALSQDLEDLNVNYSIFFSIYDKINIMVLGGSQGASFFSDAIPETIKNLPKDLKYKIHIYHQAPEKDIEKIKQSYSEHGIDATVVSFFPKIWEVMTRIHILIARSGASTIVETATFGIPVIFVPLPSAVYNHQLHNARSFNKRGGAIIIEQKDFIPNRVAMLLQKLFYKDKMLREMHNYIKTTYHLLADIKIKTLVDLKLGHYVKTETLEERRKSKFKGKFISKEILVV